jgi:phosphopantetheine adenylyltransferase
MNYTIINDEKITKDFINSLPILSEGETYYLCLFARSKYAKNEDGSNKFPHIKTDKSQLKRFLSNKEYMFNKIKQLETAYGNYLTKDGDAVPQEALALYINPNPRCQRKGMFSLMKKLIDIQECQGKGYNINAEAISAVQKSRSRNVYVDFDIDSKNIDLSYLKTILPPHGYDILETRGGYHIMVIPGSFRIDEAERNWYQKIKEHYTVDQVGDNMIPFPGSFQGGFTPRFLNYDEL